MTLTGPGGVGKTRLALEVATRLADELPGGAWLVDLAGVADPDLVAGAVATTLGVDVRHAPDDEAALVASLCRRPAHLVVLDNCEHVAEPCAAIVGSLLASCPELRVLATSRRPLGVAGEFVRPVHPLGEEQAVALFTDRARLAGVDIGTPEAAGALAAGAAVICRQLDGLPLAIELAASQVRVLTPVEIAARLDDQLRFRGRATAAPPRQRTLHDMVAWSYELLPAEGQRLYARLGVFASSMTFAAAEAVAGGHGNILGSLTTLVDHSFLAREGDGGSSRYRLLETLRLFALERLQESGEVELAHRAHAEYFCRLAAEAGRHLYGPDERAWRAQLDTEEPNLHAALRWAEAHEPGARAPAGGGALALLGREVGRAPCRAVPGGAAVPGRPRRVRRGEGLGPRGGRRAGRQPGRCPPGPPVGHGGRRRLPGLGDEQGLALRACAPWGPRPATRGRSTRRTWLSTRRWPSPGGSAIPSSRAGSSTSCPSSPRGGVTTSAQPS